MDRNEYRLEPQTITDGDRARRRIRDHVDLILALARVPSAARDDLYEELYSHLWERWRASVEAGTPPEQAAREAIASFGDAATTAGGLASTYHSRLYMSTIGALIPLVDRSEAMPASTRYLGTYLQLAAAYEIVAGVTFAIWLSPLRMALALIATLIAAGLNLIAARALDRGERWALRYAQLLVPVVLVLGAAGVFSMPRNDLAVAAGAVTACFVPFALAPDAAMWAAGARRLRRPLVIGLLAALAVSIAGGAVAAQIPDPTQAGPDDLTVTLSLNCEGSKQATVTTTIVWSRTDIWPAGPFQFTGEFLYVLVSDGPVGSEWTGTIGNTTSIFASDSPPGGASPAKEYGVGPASDFQPTAWAWTDNRDGLVIRSDMLKAGHRYTLTSAVSTELPLTRAAIHYEHAAGLARNRFTKRAEVGCGSSANAVTVPNSGRLP